MFSSKKGRKSCGENFNARKYNICDVGLCVYHDPKLTEAFLHWIIVLYFVSHCSFFENRQLLVVSRSNALPLFSNSKKIPLFSAFSRPRGFLVLSFFSVYLWFFFSLFATLSLSIFLSVCLSLFLSAVNENVSILSSFERFIAISGRGEKNLEKTKYIYCYSGYKKIINIGMNNFKMLW